MNKPDISIGTVLNDIWLAGQDFDQVLAFIGVTQDLSLLPRRTSDLEAEILAIHDSFYVALKSGDAELMKTLWEEAEEDEMPRVSWESVLSDKARRTKTRQIYIYIYIFYKNYSDMHANLHM